MREFHGIKEPDPDSRIERTRSVVDVFLLRNPSVAVCIHATEWCLQLRLREWYRWIRNMIAGQDQVISCEIPATFRVYYSEESLQVSNVVRSVLEKTHHWWLDWREARGCR